MWSINDDIYQTNVILMSITQLQLFREDEIKLVHASAIPFEIGLECIAEHHLLPSEVDDEEYTYLTVRSIRSYVDGGPVTAGFLSEFVEFVFGRFCCCDMALVEFMDAETFHSLESSLCNDTVFGRIDWQRRKKEGFDDSDGVDRDTLRYGVFSWSKIFVLIGVFM